MHSVTISCAFVFISTPFFSLSTYHFFVFRVIGLRRRQGRCWCIEPYARYGISYPLARTSPERNSILRRCPVRHTMSNSRRKHVQIPIRHQQWHAFLARPFRYVLIVNRQKPIGTRELTIRSYLICNARVQCGVVSVAFYMICTRHASVPITVDRDLWFAI